ncbi:MAG: GxxExxY protein [Bacteroidota bacterium]|nr:GxxExxY protein [Bacteroidota bacterium]
MEFAYVTEPIIRCALKVHNTLGPGLLESAYQKCLAYEFRKQGIIFEQQKILPLQYDGLELDCGYRLDFVVQQTVILEVKSVDRLLPIHDAQLLTYMRLCNMPVGLLLNFNVPLLRDGIRRLLLPRTHTEERR